MKQAQKRSQARLTNSQGVIDAVDASRKPDRAGKDHPRGDRPGRRRELRGIPSEYNRHVVGELVPGWLPFMHAYDEPPASSRTARRPAPTRCCIYFASGTTAKPQLVVHTHMSYPVSHLSTMYWSVGGR